MIPFILIAGVFVLFVVAAVRAQAAQEQALKSAELVYREALDALSEDGQNNLLRKNALDRGRHFAELARKKAGSRGVAIFDEVALTNDLTACIGSKSGTEETVACPECAEQIQPASRRCRFCGVQFEAAQAA
jgi:hypothetical protein